MNMSEKDKMYKVKIRKTWFIEEDEKVSIPIPADIKNVDGYINYILRVAKRKEESIKLLEYEREDE